MPELRLTALHVYPIKSAAGLEVPEWDIDGFGLRYDRRWMVVDESGDHLTQRTAPRLALVTPAVDRDRLVVTAPGFPPLDLPLEPHGPAVVTAVVWGAVCAARGMGEAADAWFSAFLGRRCRLVHMPDDTVRPADPSYAPQGVRVSFADAFPFLLLSEESLHALNVRLPIPVPMNRFRPNLVIAGAEPHVEDRLGDFDLGPLPFRVVKACARCVLTTTDQATTRRGAEPLRTLARYRKVGGEVLFGQNVVHLARGRLAVGATLRSYHAWRRA